MPVLAKALDYFVPNPFEAKKTRVTIPSHSMPALRSPFAYEARWRR